VRDAIDYGVSMVRERASQQSVSVVSDVAPDLGDLYADELRVRQVVLNLLSNAVKFTPGGGAVTIRAAADGPDVAVTVTDTGIGIAAEDRKRIFESFQQGSRAARRQEGTGLGLTLSKRIVELHGGRMWLDSEVDVGSTFGFTIPARTAGVPDSRARTERPAAGPVVVVIEDDRRSLDLLTLYLEGAHADVVPASTGEEGLAAVRRLRPAAVVLDIGLPGMDGWDLMAAVKDDPVTAGVPVVVVSVLDERARGLASGAASYLVKPVSRDELLSALRQVGAIPLAAASGPTASRSE
jgi:CheY-like chemotaxis protein/anti-sigma regulatory factor (Ser/Thr protein kinase)